MGGAGDAATLNHSTAPFVLPLWVARVLVSTTLGVGIGVTLGCVAGVRRHDRESDRAAVERHGSDTDSPAEIARTRHADDGLDISADLA